MENTVIIPCKGGLNLAATNEELLGRMNEAIQLVNFEVSKNGGYSRILGHNEWEGTSTPGSGRIKGVITYLGGVLLVRGTGIWHSFTGTTWTQVNRLISNANKATFDGTSLSPISTANEVPWSIDTYTEGNKTHVFMATGNSDPYYLLIEGTTAANSIYSFRQTSLGTELTGAKQLAIFEDQVILGNTGENSTALIYSSFPTTDLSAADVTASLTPREKYDGSTSGIINIKEPIIGIKAHRDSFYVFTANSIYRVAGMRDGNPEVIPVTSNIGCVDANTIQEIGGDLIFLAPDGLRTIAATERLDDVELGVISRKISPLTDVLMGSLETLEFSSVIIKSKNQYRLFYGMVGGAVEDQKGIIAHYAFDSGTNGFAWEYSETLGLSSYTAYSGVDVSGKELIVFGNSEGKLYEMEQGSAFDSTRVPWVYQTAYGDFGDIGVRKTLEKVFVNMRALGAVRPKLSLLYDYEREINAQPDPYFLDEIDIPPVLGAAVIGGFVFSVGQISGEEIYAEGSGFTASIKIEDDGISTDAPLDIFSVQINFIDNGRI